VAISFVVFGYLNFLRGFSSFRMPSLTPIASLYAAIPVCGVFVALFTVEQIVNGLRNGFERSESIEQLEQGRSIETTINEVGRP
jgi:TRAP-type C4-dicarboxylate transport system permease small subunit